MVYSKDRKTILICNFIAKTKDETKTTICIQAQRNREQEVAGP